jgi:CheY-like chemotaxis protein
MFMQGDRSLERTRGGLGVGLTLVRNLIGLHGGRIEARSEGIDRGSEFVISLPLDPNLQDAHPAPESPALRPRSRALRILVVDDNDDGREMLTYLLTSEGHHVSEADDGLLALQRAAEFDPDVAVLDIGIPGLNGYEVARRLRDASPHGRPFLIAVSGLGQPEDKARAQSAGFDRHFTKPVDVNSLLGLLDEWAIQNDGLESGAERS